MSAVDDAAAEIGAAIRPILQKLFEAAELSGYNVARQAAQAAITDAFARALNHSSTLVMAEDVDLNERLPAFAPQKMPSRATPGSVKPAILEVIRKQPGLSQDQIQAATGAKHNSVRGTLWTLDKEGRVEKRDGRYFALAARSDSSTSGEPESGTPDAGASGED